MNLFHRPEIVIELNRFFVIFSLIIFFSALFLWPLGWVFRRPALAKEDAKPLSYRSLFSISRYVSIFMILIALLEYFFLKKHPEIINALYFPGIDEAAGVGYNILISLPSLLSVMFPLHLILLIFIWTGHHGTQVFRIHFSLVSVAFMVYIIFLITWQLVFPGYYFAELL